MSWRDRLPRLLQPLSRMPWHALVVAGIVGLFLASQINAPNSRIIKLLAGCALLVIAYRTKPFYSLCFIAVAFMFPFSIFVGSSTMIFTVLTLLIYLARLSLRQVPSFQRTPLDVFIAIMLLCYSLSFYNIDSAGSLRESLVAFGAILSSMILYFLTANFIRTEEQMKTFTRVLLIMFAASIFVAAYELLFPGRVLIPHWILYHAQWEAGREGYRVGGPLADYELFGEFMAIAFFLAFFVYRRGDTKNLRIAAGVISLLCIFGLLATVTRGATLAFMGGIVYLLFCLRKTIKARDILATMLGGATVFIALQFVVDNFTASGAVTNRLFNTEFVGMLPDSRTHWPEVWARVLEHPLIGHGPFFDLGKEETISGKGLHTQQWPHNQYLLYGYTVGLIGMASFIVLVVRSLIISFKEKAVGFHDPSYTKSLMIVLHVMFLVFAVDQTKIDYLRNPIYTYFPWIILGMISASHRIIKEQESQAASESSSVSATSV